MPMISARLIYAALLAAPLALAQDFGDCPMPEKQVKLTIQNQPSTALPGQSVKYSVFATPVIGNFNPSGTISITDVTLLDSPVDLTSAKLDQGQTTLAATFYPTECRATGIAWMQGIGRFGGVAGTMTSAQLLSMQWQADSILMILSVPALVAAAATVYKMLYSRSQEPGVA